MTDFAFPTLPSVQERFSHTCWTHGSNAVLGFTPLDTDIPRRASSQIALAEFLQRGNGTEFRVFGSARLGDYVVHFPMHIHDSVQERGGLAIQSIMLAYKVVSGASITRVEIWDGIQRLATITDQSISAPSSAIILEVDDHPRISSALNISLVLDITVAQENIVEFYAAGANMIRKIRNDVLEQNVQAG